MPVLLEKYVLPILAAIAVLVLVTNPMKFKVLIRIITALVMLAVASLVSLDLQRRAKNKESSAKATSEAGAPAGRSSFTTPTPRDIYDRIKKLPLYEQEHAAQSYVGLSVHWPVRFLYMFNEKDEPEVYKVVLAHLDDEIGHVFCRLKLSQYPRLKLVHEGDTGIEITGIIRAADPDGIVFLKDAKLIFTNS